MLEDPRLCSLEKDLPFYFSGGLFSGGFRVRDADWRHLTCDTAIEWSTKEKLPAPLETVVKLTLPGQAGWSLKLCLVRLPVSSKFLPTFLTWTLSLRVGVSEKNNCPFKYSNTQLSGSNCVYSHEYVLICASALMVFAKPAMPPSTGA